MTPIIATILFAAFSFLVGFDSTIGGPSSAHAFVAPMSPSQPRMKMASSSSLSSSSSAAAAANRNVLPYPPPPPPHMSMPVWSFSCPISYATTSRLERRQLASSSSMSILTFVTPVSVSSQPRLWAISLYKTSFTRCAFLGVSNSGEEYNNIPSISSSVTTTAGFATNVRRRADMGEAGVLGDVDGAIGWRRTQTNALSSGGGGGGGGVGILQLLIPNQDKLVPILGKKTGWERNINKREECATLGYDWATTPGCNADDAMRFDILPNCATYIQVKLKRVTDGGDHDVAICEVIGTGIWNDSKQTVLWLDDNENSASQFTALDHTSALYSGQLRNQGII